MGSGHCALWYKRQMFERRFRSAMPSAMARPNARLAPVTIALRPFNRPIILLPLRVGPSLRA